MFTALMQRIKTQDMPAVVIGTPKKSKKGGDSLASDSEESQASSPFSTLSDSSDEIESMSGDHTTNFNEARNVAPKVASPVGKSLTWAGTLEYY